ncbi:hypothetical protein CPLU01_14343 [Colletotrichum plurivorum]|uniref:Uncharacterized protein n=1 Tax=Colletotrichum plurivorum TaxID=2175906 RepID=A0A8H6N037_9PEZI|nr:hypothetical protein CPLU01_14343 [Colletotrichum plurivorum]
MFSCSSIRRGIFDGTPISEFGSWPPRLSRESRVLARSQDSGLDEGPISLRRLSTLRRRRPRACAHALHFAQTNELDDIAVCQACDGTELPSRTSACHPTIRVRATFPTLGTSIARPFAICAPASTCQVARPFDGRNVVCSHGLGAEKKDAGAVVNLAFQRVRCLSELLAASPERQPVGWYRDSMLKLTQ